MDSKTTAKKYKSATAKGTTGHKDQGFAMFLVSLTAKPVPDLVSNSQYSNDELKRDIKLLVDYQAVVKCMEAGVVEYRAKVTALMEHMCQRG